MSPGLLPVLTPLPLCSTKGCHCHRAVTRLMLSYLLGSPHFPGCPTLSPSGPSWSPSLSGSVGVPRHLAWRSVLRPLSVTAVLPGLTSHGMKITLRAPRSFTSVFISHVGYSTSPMTENTPPTLCDEIQMYPLRFKNGFPGTLAVPSRGHGALLNPHHKPPRQLYPFSPS